MVVSQISSERPPPRPSLLVKDRSWRRYIKSSSNRKLQLCDPDESDVIETKKQVRFQLPEETSAARSVSINDGPAVYNRNVESLAVSLESDLNLPNSEEEARGERDDDSSDSNSTEQSDASKNVVVLSTDEDEEQWIRQQWYTKRDLEAFEKDRHLTALQYRSLKKRGAPFIEREHSIRGIEDLLDMDDSNRKHISTPSHREQHLRAVLDEQERQKQAKSFPNEAMLREISLKYSRESRNNAAALAEADALSGYVSSKRQVVQRHVQGVMRSVSRKMLLNG